VELVGAAGFEPATLWSQIDWQCGRSDLACHAYVFAMDPLWSQAAVILSAMPVAVNIYVIAQQYSVYFKTVSSVIVISTGMSIVTIFFWLIWFGVG
jgi:predicted permease